MLPAAWTKNDKKARLLIISLSLIIFSAVVLLGRIKLDINPGFDVHIFATINAFINSTVSVLLLAALLAILLKKYIIHKRLMTAALILSCLFLISYICHHLFAAETKFGGTGTVKYVYYFILGSHIVLAGIILPFILYTSYRAMTGEWQKHRKLGWITWPIWFYVAVTGVIVYLMISPFYV
jgi:putative membrane protein